MSRLFVPLNVDFPDDPKVVEAGALAELVYVRAVLRCRRYLTDGVIHRVMVGRWFAGIAQPEKQLGKLVDVGLLEPHADGWCFPERVWREWNPTKAEVEAKRADEAERKRRYRARVRDTSDDVPVGHRVAATPCPTTSETETETETETQSSSSSREAHRGGDVAGDISVSDDVEAIAWHIGRAEADERGARSPMAYAATVARDVIAADSAFLAELWAQREPHQQHADIAEAYRSRPLLHADRRRAGLRLVGTR